ncbi:MAG: sigma-70 family RNA polymerase sigma factor, partial [Planctomycetota bacterium]
MHRLIQPTTPALADEGGDGQDDRGPAEPIAANDRELLMRFCTRGDESAFAELVERHSGLVWVAVWQVLRHRQDVEDAFQATFLILARRSATIRGRDSIAGWLHRVAFRTALAVRRKRGDAKPLNGEADTLVAPEAEQLAAIGQHEERSLLLEELRALPERYQLPITLCYLEQRTRGEAADELGLSVAAVKGRLARGKQMLRARLARRGVGLSTAVAALAAPLAEAQAAVASGATAALASAAVNGSAAG